MIIERKLYLPLVHEVGKTQDGLIDKNIYFYKEGCNESCVLFWCNEGGEAWVNSEYIEQKIINHHFKNREMTLRLRRDLYSCQWKIKGEILLNDQGFIRLPWHFYGVK